MQTRHFTPFVLAVSIAVSACSFTQVNSVEPLKTAQANPQQQFFERLTAHCGKAYSGGLISGDNADADMVGRPMVMHVAACSDNEIRIPFHIETAPGKWDRSRTWIITQFDNENATERRTGLRLKHDHRHEDGAPDDITMYGGDTANAGTAMRQSFPVDAESIAMFNTGGLTASVTNVWSVTVDDESYTYALSRANRDFRVRFDLTKPIFTPPLPWGWDLPQ